MLYSYASNRPRSKFASTLFGLTVALSASACAGEETSPVGGAAAALSATVSSTVQTPTLINYDDAPRTPDPDDPAIWHGPHGAALVIVTMKEAGMQVYSATGALLQTIKPHYRPAMSPDDPPTPGGPDGGTPACPYSTTGEDFSRYNNVDVHHDFPVRVNGRTRKIDIAVVSDRGCDELRIFEIDPSRSGGPLFDVTASNTPRVFPTRYEQPSPIQSPGEPNVLVPDNDLDDENTAYGLTLGQLSSHGPVMAFATQAGRAVVGELELRDAGNGRVTYRRVREYRFNPTFRIRSGSGHGKITWSSCREDASEDPQFEGLVVDEDAGVLYAAQETVGVWRIRLRSNAGSVVNVAADNLIEPTLSFGAAYWAVPDDDEFSCEDEAPDAPFPDGTIVAAGNPDLGGEWLEADVEGVELYDAGCGEGYLIVSSQGDNTFHVFDRERPTRHLGVFEVDGAGETDGLEITPYAMGPLFPHGALVIQSGNAPEPDNTDPINGYEYDGAARFEYVAWPVIADALDL